MESRKKPRPIGYYIGIAIVVLGVLLVALFILLVRNYLTLRRANLINRRELSLSAFIQKHGPLNASEVGVIRSWMTFDYVDRLFDLPKDYLKDQLQISDSRYPNLTLSAYGSENNFDAPATVGRVQGAISYYFNQPAL
jgi:hypothetical protein